MRSEFKYILLILFAITIPIFIVAQSTSVTDRTPEQEAVKQTEKMQKELNLTPDQAKSVYEINLRYARERKQTNKRSDAVNRIKSKNEEIVKVLNERQNFELQSKRSEVQSVEIDGKRRFTRTDSKPRVIQQDRPVRTRQSPRQSQPLIPERVNSLDQKTDRPVRQNTRSRDTELPVINDRNETSKTSSSDNYRSSESTRGSYSGTNNSSSFVKSSSQRSTPVPSTVNRSSSQRSARDYDSRR